jgi:hypothetical protein
MDTDPAFFVIDLQDANKKKFFFKHFFCLLLFDLHNFPKIKRHKESQVIVGIKVFLTIFA